MQSPLEGLEIKQLEEKILLEHRRFFFLFIEKFKEKPTLLAHEIEKLTFVTAKRLRSIGKEKKWEFDDFEDSFLDLISQIKGEAEWKNSKKNS